jgi:hypothetical protein
MLSAQNVYRLATLENSDYDVVIKRAKETITEAIQMFAKLSVGYYELQQKKKYFGNEYSKLLHQRKQGKCRCLQDKIQINANNLNNVRREAGRHFRNNEEEYLRDKLNEVTTHSMNKDTTDLQGNK